MFRILLTSAAALGITAGAAMAQATPPAGGLTPGAPLGTDPHSDEGVAVGEQDSVSGGAVERRAAPMPAERSVLTNEGPYGLTFGLTPGAPTGENTETGPRGVYGSSID